MGASIRQTSLSRLIDDADLTNAGIRRADREAKTVDADSNKRHIEPIGIMAVRVTARARLTGTKFLARLVTRDEFLKISDACFNLTATSFL
jgi:hypothetical protein